MVDGGSVVQQCVAGAALAGALTDAGDYSGAADVLRGIPADGRRPETHVGPVVEDVRARLHAAQGRWEEALVATEACAAWERQFDVRHGGWMAWRALAAQAHHALGDAPRARALATNGVELARGFGVPRTVGIALRGAAAVEEDPAERARLLREALGVLEPAAVLCEAVRARAELGGALAAGGDRDGAREAYEAALTRAEAIGARALEQQARDGLVRLGSRPRRRTTSGAQSLTAGERRVAELAAQGVPNRLIAVQLFLTQKTVENHLTATYRKLGIASRAQLADRLT
jgi:DNA-binding CsgD family transcriptional regulator